MNGDNLRKVDVEYIRSDFPMLRTTMNNHPLVYFDSGASALKPQIVIDTISNFYANQYSNVHRGVYTLSQQATDAFEEVRNKVHEFIHSPLPEEIIFNSGTTEGINLIAHSFVPTFLKSGDAILISEMEHHADIVSWQLVEKMYDVELRVIPIHENGDLDLSHLEDQLKNGVKLVSVTHVSNVLGTINPIQEIANLTKSYGAYIHVDGAQAVPHMPVDVQELGVDFYTFSAHKVFGPTGLGVLFGKKELLDKMPPVRGGGDMIDKVTFEHTTFNDIPHKFEAGTPNIAGVIGFGPAIDYIQHIGFDFIHQWEEELTQYMLQKLKEIPDLRLIGEPKHRAAVFSFVVEGVHSFDIGTLLNQYGIAIRTGHHCAQPLMKFYNIPSSARATLAFYNTKEEINFFIKKLKHVIQLLQ